MAVIGLAALGCVIGWASCFTAGWRLPVLLVRLLWVAVLALLALAGRPDHIVPLVASAALGGLGHLGFVLFIHNRRADARGATL